MLRRSGRLLLGIVLLVQTGPMCACALDHALFCDELHGTAAHAAEVIPATDHSCDDARFGLESNECFRHHRGAACARRQSTDAGQKLSFQFGVPPAALFAPLTVPLLADSPVRLIPRETVPLAPPDAARSIPLLN